MLSLALILACGAFVAAEFAFITVDRRTVEDRAQRGEGWAKRLLAALQSLSTQLSGAQLGITITNLAIGFLAEPAIAHLLKSPLHAIGLGKSAVPAVAAAIALVLATAFTMLFGELVPKNLALASPLTTARRVTAFQRGFTRAMAYPIKVLNATANALLHAVGVQPQEELASARSAEELSSLLARSAAVGTLSGQTASLLQRSLTFGDKVADDVLTPRSLLSTVRTSDPLAHVITVAKRSGHSRFPVIGDRPLGGDPAAAPEFADADHIVGVIHIRQAVSVPVQERARQLAGAHMLTVALVPSALHLDPLVDVLRQAPLQMAVVVDEFGGTAGLVTMEDLVEELVGEVSDEHDRYGPPARRRRDGSWSLSGLLRPDEVAAQCDVAIPEHRAYDTVGGLVAYQMGRVPVVGDAVDLGHARLTVTRMAGRRVDRLRLELVGPGEGTESSAPDAAPGSS
jgi:CBS domain containing-hemolysin-like protein